MHRRWRGVCLILLILYFGSPICVATAGGSRMDVEWLYATCVVQGVVATGVGIFGPGRSVKRVPLAVAWLLALGITAACLPLIKAMHYFSFTQGTATLAGCFVPATLFFAAVRYRTSARLVFGQEYSCLPAAERRQFALKDLLIATVAFSVVGFAARRAVTISPNPFDWNGEAFFVLFSQSFVPTLVISPVIWVAFRPSWWIVAACLHVIVVTLASDVALNYVGSAVGFSLNPAPGGNPWPMILAAWADTSVWNGGVLAMTIICVLVARGAGFRIVLPDQSKEM